ncbi:hypothetical protein D9758_005528 [Tetrapyrgos nigripes]|uniref:CSC1/OSCA1-like 7TM region domain-containing protein n=1 Tax=Tetrapyrgos nigripes TaxID=182062 RepID=A0A8H5GGW6_9AGAR|nr:hypothetical protein D9758_005528 [Tetrapyrgos nigripes]
MHSTTPATTRNNSKAGGAPLVPEYQDSSTSDTSPSPNDLLLTKTLPDESTSEEDTSTKSNDQEPSSKSPDQDPPRPKSPPHRPKSPSSDSSDSDSEPTMSSNMPTAAWTPPDYGKLPKVHVCPVEPHDYTGIMTSIAYYFSAKGISDTKTEQARNAIASCFHAPESHDFFNSGRTRLLALSEAEYQRELIEHLLGINWVDKVAKLRGAVNQSEVCDQSFSALLEKIVAYNDMLKDTPRYLSNAQLQELKDDMEYSAWVKVVKTFDKAYRAVEKPKMDQVNALQLRIAELEKEKGQKRANTSSHYSNDQSRSRPFTDYRHNASAALSAGSSSSSGKLLPTRMRDIFENKEQKQIYMDGEICTRCRNWFAGHRGNQCSTSCNLSVPYCDLTKNDLVLAKQIHQRSKAPITMDAVLKYKSNAVAAVIPETSSAPIEDIDAFLNDQYSSIKDCSALDDWVAAGGLTEAIEAIINNPTLMLQSLANRLPGASVFFLSYMVTQGMTLRQVFAVTFRMPSIDFGETLPQLSLLATITFAYSVLNPLINFLAFVSYIMMYIACKFFDQQQLWLKE